MLDILAATFQPGQKQTQVLEVAYELYLEAPDSSYPEINLREVARKTGMSVFECRNTIVNANRAGRFPNCSLAY